MSSHLSLMHGWIPTTLELPAVITAVVAVGSIVSVTVDSSASGFRASRPRSLTT